jgi:hypothetical protein
MSRYSGSTANAATETVVDSNSATCKVALFESPTGNLAAKTDAGLTYDATTAALSATTFVGALTGTASGNYKPGGTDVAVTDGGTGSGTAAAARLALGLVDANDRMPTAMLPTKILNSYWHASFDEKTDVLGTWVFNSDASQTDYDIALSSSVGNLYNSGNTANNEEVKFGNLTLNAGTYKISFATVKASNRGIMEILLGTVSLGTYDLYTAGTVYNNVSSFTYSPTTRVTGDLRVKATGKNGSSNAYIVAFSRLEIIRTG